MLGYAPIGSSFLCTYAIAVLATPTVSLYLLMRGPWFRLTMTNWGRYTGGGGLERGGGEVCSKSLEMPSLAQLSLLCCLIFSILLFCMELKERSGHTYKAKGRGYVHPQLISLEIQCQKLGDRDPCVAVKNRTLVCGFCAVSAP